MYRSNINFTTNYNNYHYNINKLKYKNMIALITLVIPVGGSAGPFDLYSDANGYTIPFATNISAAVLITGYIVDSNL